MSNPIKHHYVPQCYLRRFSFNNIEVKYFDKLLHTCCCKEISQICQIENFYKLSQTDPYFIETTFFARGYEDKLGKILFRFENIDCNKSKISYDKSQRRNLSKQILLQYMRTPTYRNTKSENELNAYYEQIKRLLKETIGFDVEEIEYKVENKAEFHKNLLLEENDDVISELSESDWELLYDSFGNFYTSDNPVTIMSREDMPVTYCDAIKYFSEIFYPLNSNLLLHIKAKVPFSTKKINIRMCGENELSTINRLISEKAVRYIIYTNQFE